MLPCQPNKFWREKREWSLSLCVCVGVGENYHLGCRCDDQEIVNERGRGMGDGEDGGREREGVGAHRRGCGHMTKRSKEETICRKNIRCELHSLNNCDHLQRI